MLIKWEAKDIKGGRRYQKPGTGEVWMLAHVVAKDTENKVFASVSMADGMVTLEKNAKEMAELLTTEGYVPLEMIDTQYFAEP